MFEQAQLNQITPDAMCGCPVCMAGKSSNISGTITDTDKLSGATRLSINNLPADHPLALGNKSFLPNGDPEDIIDYMLTQYRFGLLQPWTNTITYNYFETAPPPSYGDGEGQMSFKPLSGIGRNTMDLQVQRWSENINLNFQRITSGTADIMVGMADLPGASGWAYYPKGTDEAGDIWLDIFATEVYSTFSNGSIYHTFSDKVILHEIGHSIGLGHSGNYNGNQGSRDYDNDNYANSVMSYYGISGYQIDGWHGYGREFFPQTPMIFDIAAAQRIYGVRPGVRATDSVYGFNTKGVGGMYDFANNQAPILTIWDGGGYDILDLSESGNDSYISLVPGTSSSVMGFERNLGIAFNTKIEAVIGAGGNDVILGSSERNWLWGYNGADSVNGGGGNDTLRSGDGADTLTGGTGYDVFIGGYDRFKNYISDFSLTDDYIGVIGVEPGGESTFTVEGGLGVRFTNGGELILLGYNSSQSRAVLGKVITLSSISPNAGATSTVGKPPTPGGGGPGEVLTGDETLTGGSGSDTLNGKDGSDLIYGLGGADSLLGGADNDTIYGGGGNDSIHGGAGADVYVFASGDGADSIRDLNPTHDKIVLFDIELTGAVTISGGSRLLLEDGGTIDLPGVGLSAALSTVFDQYDSPLGPIMLGTTNADTMNGGLLNDFQNGLAGADRLNGNAGNDTLMGGLDNDTLTGGTGADVFLISTGDGNDRIMDLTTQDRILLNGMAAVDFQTISGLMKVELTDGSFVTVAPRSTVELANLITVINLVADPNRGTILADTLNGTGTDDYMRGYAGHDVISGSTGHDTLYGGSGLDTLTGGSGNDVFVAHLGGGNDVVTDFSSGDQILASGVTLTDYTISGLSSPTSSSVTGTIKLQFGSSMSLTLVSATLADVFTALGGTSMNGLVRIGTTSADTMIGAGGNDTVFGNKGNDVLNGLSGNDVINGSLGNDTLVGGSGNDVFIFSRGDSSFDANADKLIDFNADADKIDFNTAVGVTVFDKTGLLDQASLTLTMNAAIAASSGFNANDAVLFSYGGKTYLAVNDQTATFSSSQDLLINITGYTGTLDSTDFI